MPLCFPILPIRWKMNMQNRFFFAWWCASRANFSARSIHNGTIIYELWAPARFSVCEFIASSGQLQTNELHVCACHTPKYIKILSIYSYSAITKEYKLRRAKLNWQISSVGECIICWHVYVCVEHTFTVNIFCTAKQLRATLI